MSGIYNAVGKTADAFVVEDAYPSQVNYVVAQVRFVHAISNAAPLTLYAANTTTTDTVTVGRAVTYKSAGAFIGLPAGVYNLFARYTDSTTNKITRTAVSFVGGRVYTVGARGTSPLHLLRQPIDRFWITRPTARAHCGRMAHTRRILAVPVRLQADLRAPPPLKRVRLLIILRPGA